MPNDQITQFHEISFDGFDYDSHTQLLGLQQFVENLENSYDKTSFITALQNFDNHRWLYTIETAHPNSSSKTVTFEKNTLIEAFRVEYNKLATVRLSFNEFSSKVFYNKFALFELMRRLVLNANNKNSYYKSDILTKFTNEFETPFMSLIPIDLPIIENFADNCRLVDHYLNIDLGHNSTIFFDMDEGNQTEFSSLFKTDHNVFIEMTKHQMKFNNILIESAVVDHRFLIMVYEDHYLTIYYHNTSLNTVDKISYFISDDNISVDIETESDNVRSFCFCNMSETNSPLINELIIWNYTLPLNQIQELVRSGRG